MDGNLQAGEIHNKKRSITGLAQQSCLDMSVAFTMLAFGNHLQAICAEVWVLKELSEAFHVSFPAHVGQVWHHVGYHFEASVLCQVEAVTNCCYCVPSVCVSSDILKNALQAYLQPGAAI